MFDECGTKLKSIAIFFFVLGVIGAIIILIVPFATDTAEHTFFPALFGAAVDLFLSYVGTLVLYTIGETWENTAYYRSQGHESIIRPGASIIKKPEASAKSKPVAMPDGGWKCNCGHVNSAVKNACSKCGMPKES